MAGGVFNWLRVRRSGVLKFRVLYNARNWLAQEIVATPERICSMDLADGWLVGWLVGPLVGWLLSLAYLTTVFEENMLIFNFI